MQKWYVTLSPTRCCQRHHTGNITFNLSLNDFKVEVKLVSGNTVTFPADILKASDISGEFDKMKIGHSTNESDGTQIYSKNNDLYVSQSTHV